MSAGAGRQEVPARPSHNGVTTGPSCQWVLAGPNHHGVLQSRIVKGCLQGQVVTGCLQMPIRHVSEGGSYRQGPCVFAVITHT